METEKRARVWSNHWAYAYTFAIKGDVAFPDMCPSIPYPLEHLRKIATRWEDIAEDPKPPALPDITDRAFCAWCDNRSLDQRIESLEKRTGREHSTVWLCNIHAAMVVDALDSMVRQHCYLDDEEGFDSGALRANCEAMEMLIKNKSAVQVNERVGRRMFIKIRD